MNWIKMINNHSDSLGNIVFPFYLAIDVELCCENLRQEFKDVKQETCLLF